MVANGKFITFALKYHCFTKLKTQKIMKALGYIGAFLGGAIAGAAIGLLAAPDSGSETRKKIKNTVGDFCTRHNIKLSQQEMAELAEDLIDVNE